MGKERKVLREIVKNQNAYSYFHYIQNEDIRRRRNNKSKPQANIKAQPIRRMPRIDTRVEELTEGLDVENLA